MANLLLRISLVLRLLHTVLYFLPKMIRSILTCSCSTSPQSDLKSPAKEAAKAEAIIDESELRRVFLTFDHDGDGKITREELQDSLENLGIFVSEGDLSAMICRIDSNGDGCVDIEEFREMYWAIVGGHGGREEAEEDVREAFEVFDVDGDGYITAEELRSVLASLGLRQEAEEEIRGMIGRVDEDGDGRVSLEEFREMMRVGGFAALD